MSIELKRHHRQRLKANRRFHWGRVLETPRLKGIAINTPHPCSCPMCGNERKYTGERTVQERRQMQREGWDL